MSPLAKQLKVHNFLYTIHTAEEPFDSDCFSVVGALLRDRCVCEGFAKAYKLLCDRLGIASIVVVGEALHENGQREPHSWNITRIKGVPPIPMQHGILVSVEQPMIILICAMPTLPPITALIPSFIQNAILIKLIISIKTDSSPTTRMNCKK